MAGDRIYLDYNAGAPLRPSVRRRVIALLDQTGNASSVHAEGRRARGVVEAARAAVARLVEVPAEAVTFTSGATESAALALTPHLSIAGDERPARLLLCGTEHPAVLQGHRFPAEAVSTVPVTGTGVLDLDALDVALDASDGRPVLALQAANGETGVLQPVAEAAARVHARGGLVVCDAAQAAGRIDCRAATLGADALLLSAHKLGGPQGVGALVALREDLRIGEPLVRGGGQERGLRGGTENVAAIGGFGMAATMVEVSDDGSRQKALREQLEQRLTSLAPEIVIFGAGVPRLPNTTAFAVPGLGSETVLIALDLAGIAVSTGSACSSGKVSRSRVLEAMGVDTHISAGLVRVSLGWATVQAHVDRLVDVLDGVLRRAARRGLIPAA